MNKLASLLSLTVSLLVAGQSNANDKSMVAERIYTVKEFSYNIEFAKEVDDKCRNNLGELRDDPNCINAREAIAKDRLIGSGNEDSFKAPRID